MPLLTKRGGTCIDECGMERNSGIKHKMVYKEQGILRGIQIIVG